MAENTFDILRGLVAEVKCKPGWTFRLLDEDGALRLVITVPGADAFNPERKFTVQHYHPVPTTTFNSKSWRRWIFDQCLRTETHEISEWLRFGSFPNEEIRPFLPTHGPGEDPYANREYRNEDDAFARWFNAQGRRPKRYSRMKFPEQFRWADAPHGYHSNNRDPFGWFIIPARSANGRALACLATDGDNTGWEHVSVSIEDKKKCPSWPEMCIVKDLFWGDDETVMQLHPPKSEYVNNHEGCLHLWRPIKDKIPLPSSILVGYKELNKVAKS